MDMAKKASRLVFEPPHELKLKLEIDALLLPADHKPDHSAPRKILEFSTLAECQQLRALYP